MAPTPISTAQGVGLRDWFAGVALSGMLAKTDRASSLTESLTKVQVASLAYEYADLMLKAREGKLPAAPRR